MPDLTLPLPSFIKPEHAKGYGYMMSQLVPTPTAQAPYAAHELLLGLPEVDDDYWLANVIALAAQLPQLDVARLTQLSLPGVRSLVKLYCVLAGRLQFDAMQGYEGEICRAAIEGRLGKDELATMPVRRLLGANG